MSRYRTPCKFMQIHIYISRSRDGSPLSETDRIKMVSDGKTRKLIIKKAQTDDAGNYSCIIKNENGSQGSYGTLKVKCKLNH